MEIEGSVVDKTTGDKGKANRMLVLEDSLSNLLSPLPTPAKDW